MLQTWPNLLAKALGAPTAAAPTPATAQVASTNVAPATATVTLDVAAIATRPTPAGRNRIRSTNNSAP